MHIDAFDTIRQSTLFQWVFQTDVNTATQLIRFSTRHLDRNNIGYLCNIGEILPKKLEISKADPLSPFVFPLVRNPSDLMIERV